MLSVWAIVADLCSILAIFVSLLSVAELKTDM